MLILFSYFIRWVFLCANRTCKVTISLENKESVLFDSFQYLASLLRRLIMIMEEIAPLLEKGSGIATTDWTTLRIHYKTEEDHLRERQEPPIAIPPMSFVTGEIILGAGGFGAVYKARFASVIRCSVKLVDDSMFKWEQHACVDKVVGSLVNHPLLVKYHACFTVQNAYVTIMEYIRGVDLDRVVHTAKGLPMRVLRPVVAQLGIATQYLHFKGFIHRDIKVRGCCFDVVIVSIHVLGVCSTE